MFSASRPSPSFFVDDTSRGTWRNSVVHHIDYKNDEVADNDAEDEVCESDLNSISVHTGESERDVENQASYLLALPDELLCASSLRFRLALCG